MIRVLLAEDQAMVRGALAALLRLEGDMEVVAEVARGDAVAAAAKASQPNVALLDIELPGCDGLAAAAELRTVGAYATLATARVHSCRCSAGELAPPLILHRHVSMYPIWRTRPAACRRAAETTNPFSDVSRVASGRRETIGEIDNDEAVTDPGSPSVAEGD